MISYKLNIVPILKLCCTSVFITEMLQNMLCLCFWIVTNCQSIPLRIPQGGKKCCFFMLCYISGICYICGLKTECNYILLMNFPPHILPKWIEHSLHLRKRKTDVNVQRALNTLHYTDLSSLRAHLPLPLCLCLTSFLYGPTKHQLLSTVNDFHMNILQIC